LENEERPATPRPIDLLYPGVAAAQAAKEAAETASADFETMRQASDGSEEGGPDTEPPTIKALLPYRASSRGAVQKGQKILRAGAYGRMSKPSKNGANYRSAQQQVAVCTTDAPRHGLRVVETYVDDNISGVSIEARQGIKRLIADIERGWIQAVIVPDISRIGRTAGLTVPLIEWLYSLGVGIYVVGVGLMAKSTAMSQALAAEQGVIYIRISTAQSLKDLAIEGKNTSRPPYGYRRDPLVRGGLIKIDEEIAFIKAAAKELLEGKQNVNEVIRDFNRRGYRTRYGKLWTRQSLIGTLRRPGILRSAVIAGRVVYNKTITGTSPQTGKQISERLPIAAWTVADRIGDTAVFTQGEYLALQSLFSNRLDAEAKPGPATFLRGRCKCISCGASMINSGANYMRCSDNFRGGPCENNSMYRRTMVEDAILRRIQNLFASGYLDSLAAREYERRTETQAAVFRDDIEEASRKLTAIQTQIRNIRLSARQGLPAAWVAEDLTTLAADEATADVALQRLKSRALAISSDVAAIDRIRRGFADIKLVLAGGAGARISSEAATTLSAMVDEVKVTVEDDVMRLSVRGMIEFDEVVQRRTRRYRRRSRTADV
jgi:DNA invertase Pin-like site-specific DNA recombinase